MNLSKHGAKDFWLTEFVSKEVYERMGDRSIHLLDPRLFVIAQVIRNYVDTPITVNNWFNGGKYQERGFRLLNTLTGIDTSYHKVGKATDISWDFKVKDIDTVVGYILYNKHLFMQLGLGGIGVYEWGLHLDTRELETDEFVTW